jgi:phosphatidylglycerophosphate synthase
VTSAAAPSRFQAQLPNALTIFRLALIPVFIALVLS